MVGEIDKTEDGVLFIRSIHVKYRLVVKNLDDRVRGKIERAMRYHPARCPVARTIQGCVAISTDVEIIEE